MRFLATAVLALGEKGLMLATFLLSEEQVESHSIRQEVEEEEEEGIRSGDEEVEVEVEVEVTLWRLEAGARLRERMGRVGDLRGSGACSSVDCTVLYCTVECHNQATIRGFMSSLAQDCGRRVGQD